MTWAMAGLILLLLLGIGGLVGLVRNRAFRGLLLALPVVASLALFAPVVCSTAEAETGANDAGQFGGQTFCSTFYGVRLPEASALDGDASGYALALGGAALALLGGSIARRRRRALERAR